MGTLLSALAALGNLFSLMKTALSAWFSVIWYQRGKEHGRTQAGKEIAEKTAKAQADYAELAADNRTVDDTVDKLKKGEF